MDSSAGQLSITQTAAGLPEKGLSVKASTMYCFISALLFYYFSVKL
jgi:hypothetical protein